MASKKIKPFIVYVFRDEHTYYAVGRAFKKNGIDELYQYGFKIQKDPNKKLFNLKINQEGRAKREVITRVSNALNAIYAYGKKVLDRDGNISAEKFAQCERHVAEINTPKNVGNKSFFDEKGEPRVSLNKIKPFKHFEVKEISMEEAIKLKLFDL
jgi:hypothetical protein